MDNKCSSNSSNLDKNDNQVKIYPVVLQPSTEVALETESINSESEEWTGDVVKNGTFAPQTSTINVEKSSDVVIGPLTQFHGPVTIYQNINPDNIPSKETLNVEFKSNVVINGSAAKPPPESSFSEKLHPNEEKCLITSYKQLAIYASIILIMLITIIVGIAFSLNTTSDGGSESDKNTYPQVPDGENSTTNHIMFTKQQWGGRPSLNFTKPLEHPTEYVLISHTATPKFCKSYEECAPILQSIQSFHVQNDSPDIGYNFLIGGDGNIYVGRGWDVQNFHRNHNIGISFIGNFVYDHLTTEMISALKELLELGVNLKKLAPDYKLVCHNQTYATLSPGKNVFKEMIKFPNYYPGHVQIP